MWYGVEYAYGKSVLNNGTRADKIYKFSRRKLAFIWVDDGPAYSTEAGYRELIPARHELVRKYAEYHINGDEIAKEIIERNK
jgi:hypothetical protein